MTATLAPPDHADVVIVGTGFSGMATAVRMLAAGLDDFVVLERADDVGGTWRDNSYPGCACDVPSHLYSLSFAPNPNWSSTFSPQPEIQAYLRDVADRHGIRERTRFGCELQEASWDNAVGRWRLETSRGAMTARVVIASSGPLSEASIPELPGVERFEGRVFHSAQWDHSHGLAGRKVAVVGTGASAIQFVPEIQPQAAKLTVFQRTPPWIMPRRARPLTRAEHVLYRRIPAAQRLMRRAVFWAREAFALPMLRVGLSKYTRKIAMAHLHRQIPDDAELRAKVTPDYAPGCKRILISNDYLRSLSKPNVDLVTAGIAEIRERSVVTADGTEHEVDTIIFGTGFHVTDLSSARHIRGRDGALLADVWQGSPQAHRGTTIAGFPNLFFLLGPNTGLGHNSVVVMAEAQAHYAVQALEAMRSEGIGAVDVRPDAQAEWNASIQRRMKGTVWTEGGCNSWYIDRNGLNTTLWPDFSYRFVRALRRFDRSNYVALPPSGGDRIAHDGDREAVAA